MNHAEAENAARTLGQVTHDVFYEGTGQALYEMALSKIVGQVPDGLEYGCTAQLLAMAAASSASIAMAGRSEKDFKEGMAHMADAFSMEIQRQIKLAKLKGLFT